MAANEPKRECNKPVAKTIYIQVRQLRERGGVGEAGRQTERGKKNLSHTFLISNFHHVLNVVFFLLGDSPASEFYVLTLQNTLSVPSSKVV